MLKAALLTLLLAAMSPAVAISVVFINPGRQDETFWADAAAAMHKAADSLDMRLQVLYAERDHMHALRLAREIVARPAAERPDYLVVTNDYGVGPALLDIIAPSGIATFFAFSGIDDVLPRDRHRFWLGSLEPLAEQAGYVSARALFAQARKHPLAVAGNGRMELIAIAGDRSTPSSTARTQGMLRAVEEAGDVTLRQQVYGDWRRDKAAEQAQWLFRRYPAARLVWAGNDQMAFGAIDAWRQQGGTPGTDGWFAGINTSDEALRALQSGELAALAGGHFMTGAWAMVLLYDHAHGIDFAAEGLRLTYPGFILFDQRLARRFMQLFARQGGIDFRAYSKKHNPRLERYDFDFSHMLQ